MGPHLHTPGITPGPAPSPQRAPHDAHEPSLRIGATNWIPGLSGGAEHEFLPMLGCAQDPIASCPEARRSHGNRARRKRGVLALVEALTSQGESGISKENQAIPAPRKFLGTHRFADRLGLWTAEILGVVSDDGSLCPATTQQKEPAMTRTEPGGPLGPASFEWSVRHRRAWPFAGDHAGVMQYIAPADSDGAV